MATSERVHQAVPEAVFCCGFFLSLSHVQDVNQDNRLANFSCLKTNPNPSMSGES